MNAVNSYLKKEVAVIGANTAFGKMTSFLLKQSPLLSKLTLYDDKNIKPLDDIKYINTPCKVSFVNGREQMSEAIKTADIIVVGDDNLKGMSNEAAFMNRSLSFSNNIRRIADLNSYAIIVIATSPVNMTVPLAAEVLRNLGKFDERKLIGMSNVESIMARSILAQHLQISPTMIDLPVVGGLTSETCVPLVSNMSPCIPLSKANLQKITCAVKTSGTKLQNGEGSQESLNRAYATAKLIKSIVTGLNGHPTVETVLSYQKIIDDTDFFSLPVLLGENGIINHVPLPSISQREKYLLSHAITCMAAESKKAKNCYHKISNKLVKAISAPQNRLNKLKTPAIKYNQPQSQYTSIENGTKNTFHPTTSNGTDSCDKKIKANLDHIYASIYSCNENIKKSINHNKNKTFNIKKSHIQYSAKNRKENDDTLIRKDDTSKILNKKEKQSEHIQGEIPKSHYISSSDVTTCYDTLAKHLDEPLQFKIRNKTGHSAPGLTLDNKKLASESEKTKSDENGLFEFKSATKNLNTEKEIISTNPIVNFINTILIPPQFGNKSQNCAVGENKSPVKCNNSAEQTNASKTISTDPQQTCTSSDSLENIFTSNIVRMVNETEERKRRTIGTLGSIEDQSEHKITNLNNRPKGTNDDLESNTNNDKYFDLFKMSSTKMDDISLIINKTEIEPMSSSSFIVSDDIKTSGEKYSLQTNQPHRILHSMLFKSHQSSKRPMLSRYVSSGSSENELKKINAGVNSVKEVRQMASLSKPLRSANKPQETYLSESVDKGINNEEFINSNCGNIEKQTVTSITKSQANIKSPREVFLSRCVPLESVKKKIENSDFNSENKIKQASSLPKLKTNTAGSQEPSWSPDAASEYQERGMGNKQFNLEEKVRRINPLPTTRKNVNKPDESLAVTSKVDGYDTSLSVSKFSSVKRYEAQRKIYINPMKSSDTIVFENLLQKQMDSISSGHKIASFKSESIENSFSTLQRKATSIEMLDKNVQHRNNPNDFQKLHVLTKNSKVYLMKDKLLDNELKSSGVNESHWNNNYFKKNSKRQISQKSGENIETVQHQCNRNDKKYYSDQEHEQIECKSTGNKSFDTSNNQPESVHFKYRQKETMSDDNEPVSEVINSSIDDCNLSTPQVYGPGVNSGDHDNNSKYIQQRSVEPSEANLNYTEEIKSEESSLKHITSKESKKETT